jgi:hypothetical protein
MAYSSSLSGGADGFIPEVPPPQRNAPKIGKTNC